MRKRKLIQWAFSIGQKRLLRKMFEVIDIKTVTCEGPLLIVVNHSNFYDSLVIFELEQRGMLPQDVIAVMGRDGLEKNPIFKGLGVVPVSNPMKLSEFKSMLRVMKTNPLLLFPQGKEEHQEKRPLHVEKGTATLLAKNPTHHVLCISLYYSFSEKAKGRIACKYHLLQADVIPKEMDDIHALLVQTMTEQLDALKEQVIHGDMLHYERLWL